MRRQRKRSGNASRCRRVERGPSLGMADCPKTALKRKAAGCTPAAFLPFLYISSCHTSNSMPSASSSSMGTMRRGALHWATVVWGMRPICRSIDCFHNGRFLSSLNDTYAGFCLRNMTAAIFRPPARKKTTLEYVRLMSRPSAFIPILFPSLNSIAFLLCFSLFLFLTHILYHPAEETSTFAGEGESSCEEFQPRRRREDQGMLFCNGAKKRSITQALYSAKNYCFCSLAILYITLFRDSRATMLRTLPHQQPHPRQGTRHSFPFPSSSDAHTICPHPC